MSCIIFIQNVGHELSANPGNMKHLLNVSARIDEGLFIASVLFFLPTILLFSSQKKGRLHGYLPTQHIKLQ